MLHQDSVLLHSNHRFTAQCAIHWVQIATSALQREMYNQRTHCESPCRLLCGPRSPRAVAPEGWRCAEAMRPRRRPAPFWRPKRSCPEAAEPALRHALVWACMHGIPQHAVLHFTSTESRHDCDHPWLRFADARVKGRMCLQSTF